MVFAQFACATVYFRNPHHTAKLGIILLMQVVKNDSDKRQRIILFADDDAACREVGVKILQKLGYRVLDAKDGKEAIEIFLKHQREVNLVILDMKMPYNGVTAFYKLKQIDANVKVLIASGYAKDQQVREMMRHGCNGFIQKPFTVKAISEKIASILNERA